MKYRELFVSFKEKDGSVEVFLDGNFIDRYHTETKNQEEFEKECQEYLDKPEGYQAARKRWFGK